MKQILLRVPFALAGLLTMTILMSCNNKSWKVIPIYNNWGDKIIRQYAVSKLTSSINRNGEKLFLKVDSDCSSYITNTADIDDDKSFSTDIQSSSYGTSRNFIINLPMRVNGTEMAAYGEIYSFGAHVLLYAGSFHDLPRSDYGHVYTKPSQIQKMTIKLAKANTVKIILPTREDGTYSDLIYKFDMTGAREAIQTICPGLK